MIDRVWLKRGLILLLAYLFYLYSWQSAFGKEAQSIAVVQLKGHLDQQELTKIDNVLLDLVGDDTIVVVLNSSSGELAPVLNTAKKIYEKKTEENLKIILFIDENAVGPAAIFPFLADELYASLFVSWGDIPLGNEKVFPVNILRNRVVGLIEDNHGSATLLRMISSAMCDPSMHLIHDNGWKIAKDAEPKSEQTVSFLGETLVLNHHQLKELKIVQELLPLEKFLQKFHIKKAEEKLSAPFPTLQGYEMPKFLLDEELKKYIQLNPSQKNVIGHILIDDRTSGINQSTWLYVKSALEYYKKIKPAFVILELNTPGGEVFAAQKISDALKDLDTQANIPVVAFINNWAISAGAMLAYSCRFIAVVKDGSMGAAEPVIQDASGKMEAASEKINSALRADFANRARFFSRNPLLAQAMVDKDMILVKRYGKVVKLDNENQIQLNGSEPDQIISLKGKLLTLDAEQLIKFGVADFLVPPTKTRSLTAIEESSGKWPAEKMALFHQPFFDQIPNAEIDSYRMDWRTRFFAILASPLISSLLFLGLIIGIYMEVTNPGLSIPGTLAVTCLFLIVLSSFSLEIGNWLELILLIVGLAIILVELFVLPTFGLLGFIGLIFFLVGLFGMMLPGIGSVSFEFDTQTFNAAGEAFFKRLAWLSATLVFGFFLIVIFGRYITPKFSGFNRFVLKGNEQVGFIAGDNPAELPKVEDQGEAATTLRPSGKAVINGRLYDAMTAGSFIDRGTAVIVQRIEGNTVVVRAKDERSGDHKL